MPVGIRREDGQGFVLVPVERWHEDLKWREQHGGQRGLIDLRNVVMDLVCEALNCSREIVFSKRRQSSSLFPRQVVIFLLREKGLGFSEIGQYFSCHHSTVMNAVESLEKRLSESEYLRVMIEDLRQELDRVLAGGTPGTRVRRTAWEGHDGPFET
jgi:hypothetical protein